MAFKIPNVVNAFNSNQAAPDSVDFDILTQGYGGTGVVSGCLVTASVGLTVAIASGVVMIGGAVVSVSGTTKTSAAADPANPRFDLVVVDNTGTVTIQKGTAGATPAFPVVPASNTALASLFIDAAQVTTGAAQIYDRRVILLNTMSAGVSTGGNTVGNTGQVTNQIVFMGGNNITLSGSTQSGSMSVTISGAAQAAFSGGVSTAGNTAGTTGLVGSQILLVGGSNVTLSQSSNLSSASISFIAGGVSNALQDISTATAAGTGISQFAAHDHVHRGMRAYNVQGVASTFFGDVQFSAGSNMALSTGGNTTAGSIAIHNLLSSATTVQSVGSANSVGTVASRFAMEDHQHAGLQTLSLYAPYGDKFRISNTYGNSVVLFAPEICRQYVSASVADLFGFCSYSSNGGFNYAVSASLYIGIYTRNAATLSLASSGSQSYAATDSSGGSSASLSLGRRFTVPININMTPGNYWIGFVSNTTFASNNWLTINNIQVAQGSAASMIGDFAAASNVTNQMEPGLGIGPSTAGPLYASVAFSSITGISMWNLSGPPYVVLRNIAKA